MQQQVPDSYNGEILRVNLSDQKVTTEQIDALFCRKYLGGTGFIAYNLLNLVKSGFDLLSPESKLILHCDP